MKLKNAAKYFDRDKVYDAYTGLYLFNAQFSPFEASSPDGNFNRRRTISVADDVLFPTRGVISVYDAKWVLGSFLSEGFSSRVIRKSAASKEVTGLFTLLTPGQAALQSPVGVNQMYGHESHASKLKDAKSDSLYYPQYDVTFSNLEVLVSGYFLRSDSRLLYIRGVEFANEGYWVCTADDVSLANQVDVELSGEYDPVIDQYLSGIFTTAILIDTYKVYNFNTQADTKIQPGDMSIVISKDAINPVAGQDIVINTVKWRNVSYVESYDSWVIQVRRA